jgi:hypothetical protein
VSSPEPDLSETSRILLRKAEEDATAVREFAGNPEIGDSIIGFQRSRQSRSGLRPSLRRAAFATALFTTSTA